MKSPRSSVRLCCFVCALLSGILSLMLSQGLFPSIADGQEKPAADASSSTEDSANGKPAAVATKKPERYLVKRDHDPNGTGRFYMGREIALVMGFPAAVWLERPEREEEENLTRLVQELKLKPGQSVADIGAGSGVISIMMAHVVGDTGKVFAVDLQPEMLALLGDKIKNLNIKNIEPVLAIDKLPKLEAESIDLAVMVDVYHEFEFPYEAMVEISKALKPGGRVAFVEYRREDPEVPIKLIHKMSEKQIKKEIAQPEFGLQWKETIRTLPRQHIVVFERQSK